MGIVRSAAKTAALRLVPVGLSLAPQVSAGFAREVLGRAIDGAGPFRGAAAQAELRLRDSAGDPAIAVSALIDGHVRVAGLQGFVTNLGGLVTVAVGVPANITGLALLQSHLVAGITHVRGYDLDDQRVRNAILACLLGPEAVPTLVGSGTLPATPMGLATSPVHDVELDQRIAQLVTAELLGRVGARRVASSLVRRVPLLGGGIGAVGDARSTYRVGRYAEQEFRSRSRITGPAG